MRPRLTVKVILLFFLPLILMQELHQISHSVIHAFLARLPNPKETIASFSIAFAFVTTFSGISSVCIQACICFVKDRHKGDPMKKTQRYRKLIESRDILVCPAIYDCFSAKLAESMGFEAIGVSGAGISNSFLGQPDVGFMNLGDNLTVTRNIVRSVDIPVTGDADTGYGNAVNVYHTVRLFEETGVVGINLEDQVSPKRCGHLKGKQIIPQAEMVKKVEAAVAGRKDPDFLITARTDAATFMGVDEAVKRANAYIDAGADIVYPDGILSENDIRRFVESVHGPVRINMGFVIRKRPTTPLISFKTLEELGVAVVSFARMAPAAAIAGMRNAFAVVKESMERGEVIEKPELVADFDEITDLMGLPSFLELENRFLTDEMLKEKYES